MAGGREERVLKLRRANSGRWKPSPQAIGRPHGCWVARTAAPALRSFRRDTLLPGQPRSGQIPLSKRFLHNLALDIVVNLPIVTVSCAISISLFFFCG